MGCLESLKRTLTAAETVWLKAENSLQEYTMERAALNAHKRQLFAGWSQAKHSNLCSDGNIASALSKGKDY